MTSKMTLSFLIVSIYLNSMALGFTTVHRTTQQSLLQMTSSSSSSRTENNIARELITNRRTMLKFAIPLILPLPVYAKCTDIESCREIGERKVEKDIVENPVTKLASGVRYKVLQAGIGEQTVNKNSNLDLIFSVSTMSGGYMYSRGFGYEKVDMGNGKMVKDAGLDSIRVKIGQKNVPVGIEDAVIGMKKGERRRVELPPNQGLITSDWQPEPTSRGGKAGLEGYKRMVEGTAGRPAFPAATIWDVEVLRIKN